MKKRLFLRFLAISSIFVSYGYVGLLAVGTEDDGHQVSEVGSRKAVREILRLAESKGYDATEIVKLVMCDQWIDDMGIIFEVFPNLERVGFYRCSIGNITTRGSMAAHTPRLYFLDKCNLRGVDWSFAARENFYLNIDNTCDFDLSDAIGQMRELSKDILGSFAMEDSVFERRKKVWMGAVWMTGIIEKLKGWIDSYSGSKFLNYDWRSIRVRRRNLGRVTFAKASKTYNGVGEIPLRIW